MLELKPAPCRCLGTDPTAVDLLVPDALPDCPKFE